MMWKSWESLLCYTIFYLPCVITKDIQLHQKFGTVSEGAFDRYEIKNVNGKIKLELESITGDSDLYVSFTTLRPTYTDYDYQSNTCGLDSVELSCTYGQVVGVSVFCYPFYNESSYKLTVWQVDEEKELTFEELDEIYNTFNENFENEESDMSAKEEVKPKGKHVDEETGSLSDTLWTIMITFLKILLDILV